MLQTRYPCVFLYYLCTACCNVRSMQTNKLTNNYFTYFY